MTPPSFASLISLLGLLAQEPVTGFTADTVAARPDVAARGRRFLNLAYTVVWVVLAVYFFTLSVRLRRLARIIERLKARAGL